MRKSLAALLALAFALTVAPVAALAADNGSAPAYDASDVLAPTQSIVSDFFGDVAVEIMFPEQSEELAPPTDGEYMPPTDEVPADDGIDPTVATDMAEADAEPYIDPSTIVVDSIVRQEPSEAQQIVDALADQAATAETATEETAAPAAGPQLLYSSTTASRIIAHGKTHMGDPYRFGSEGPYSWDCSSFVQHTYRRYGISLPRTAYYQSRRGTFITKANRRPGDLVFFKNTYKPGVSHVGIYLGNNYMLHAWPHGGVKISSLRYSYYVNHYWGAKRVIR